MDNRLWIGITLIVAVLAGAFFVSAELSAEPEPVAEEPVVAEGCSYGAGCGQGGAGCGCGGACEMKKCGCGKLSNFTQ